MHYELFTEMVHFRHAIINYLRAGACVGGRMDSSGRIDLEYSLPEGILYSIE